MAIRGKSRGRQPGREDQALRESEARFRSLTHLSSDWYWEQDTEYRFTRMEGRHVAGGDESLRDRLFGKRRWETGLQCEGGWEAHLALLAARQRFLDVLMWRPGEHGSVRYLRVSGEPFFASDGSFAGYRGVGRDVTAEKRAEQILRLEHQIASALSEAADERTGVRAVLRLLCEAEGWGCGRYFIVDEAHGVLRFFESWCADPAFREFLANSRDLTFQPGGGLVGRVWLTGDPIWSADTLVDPRVQAKWLASNVSGRGAFVFAVASEGRRIGVVSITSRDVRQPDERLLQAARVIGGQLGQFLQRKRTEEALRESEARFRALTQMSSDFFWETDLEHRFTQFVHGSGYNAKLGQQVLGKAAWDLPSTSPDEAGWAALRATMEARRLFREFELGRPRQSGAPVHFSVSGDPRFGDDGRFLGYRGVGRDITDVVLARERVASLAYSDPLTGLANRTGLGPAFEQAIERARRRGDRLATMFVDLDGFKQVNDVHGHAAGDRFLAEIARRLRACLRASDLLARIGGDEFFVVLEDQEEARAVETVARKVLVEVLRAHEIAPGAQVQLSASIGIALFPGDAQDAATLMKHADTAMYRAKQAGKNAFRFFSTEAPSAKQSPSSVT
jgi:diguanylate cyclase (GGDEF)-like protein/PAS domain S-box-containing protein